MGSYGWKKIRFTRECVYDYRQYGAGEEPDQWFEDWKATEILANGDGEVLMELGVDTSDATPTSDADE